MEDYLRVATIMAGSDKISVIDYFDSSPETMESLVGRVMDTRSFGVKGVLIWVNNDTNYTDLPVNFSIIDKDTGAVIDVIRGNVVITSSDQDGNVLGLSDDDIEELIKDFHSEGYFPSVTCTSAMVI